MVIQIVIGTGVVDVVSAVGCMLSFVLVHALLLMCMLYLEISWEIPAGSQHQSSTALHSLPSQGPRGGLGESEARILCKVRGETKRGA